MFVFELAFVFVFGQSVTAIFVAWWITRPFCAVNAVGIASFDLQRFALAESAELGPVGSFNSNVLTGTSGTERNVELVMLALL